MENNKPRFFGLVGWSWVAMGALGVLFGLLSLPSLFQVEKLKELLLRPELSEIPGLRNSMEALLQAYVPLTLLQLVLSIFMVWAAIKFLQGVNWGRLGLSLINGLVAISMIFLYQWIFGLYKRMEEAYRVREMVEWGLIINIPLLFRLSMALSFVIAMLPLVWMGWYFHSKKVKTYFLSRRRF